MVLCVASSCAERPAPRARLYAAASLAPALGRLEGAPPMAPVVAGSPVLAQQIRGGAPPGVVLLADGRWADVLEEQGLVEDGTRVDLLGNGLAVVAPEDAAPGPRTLGELGDPSAGRIAVAETGNVPLGRYARSALESAGVWESVRPRLIEVGDARAVVTLVVRGEADLGIVYASDAGAPGLRRVLDVPGDLHPPIAYPLLLLRGAPQPARELWTWLQGPEAAAAFRASGFAVPAPR